MLSWLLAGVAYANPDAAVLTAAWTDVSESVRVGSPVPVPLELVDLGAIAEGKTVARRSDTPDGAFAFGAGFLALPVEWIWVAIQDSPHDTASPLHCYWLPGASPEHRRVYMLMDLPWPVSDRQWVTDIRSNADLYAATQGRVWQRHWTVGDPALAPNPDPAAIWLATNRGSWTLMPVQGGTVAVFAVRTVLGGVIPTSITQQWALHLIKDSFVQLATRAGTMPAHYDAAHDAMYSPDGSVLSPGLSGR